MNEQIEYILIRAKRRTISMRIDEYCRVVVRAPLKMSKADIESFVERHRTWIKKQMERAEERRTAVFELDDGKISELTESARQYIPGRVEHFAAIMGVKPTSVKITRARKRFGSCSGKNGLCFSYTLMLYPPELIDCVVVHELAHIQHHDHSAAFYEFIKRFMPDYRERERRLKNGELKKQE